MEISYLPITHGGVGIVMLTLHLLYVRFDKKQVTEFCQNIYLFNVQQYLPSLDAFNQSRFLITHIQIICIVLIILFNANDKHPSVSRNERIIAVSFIARR